jgi:ATP-dependent DNA ligase
VTAILPTSLEPALAELVPEIPIGPEWVYEPKWEGFRCLAFRDGGRVELMSRSGQPLARYFPEVVAAIHALPAPRAVLDGEIVVPVGNAFSFDDLLQRIHPAESRVRKLAAETPAVYLVFDLLTDEKGRLLVERPWRERRAGLERFAARNFPAAGGRIRLSPVSTNVREARTWLGSAGGGLDGVIAKRADLEYRSGDRTGMQKVKKIRTADCVVGGFRYASKKRIVGSLLLGLYTDGGDLDHVGFCSAIAEAERRALTASLEALVEPPGFTGRAPGGPSRWSSERSGEWEPLRRELVVEVRYDHFSQGRFRHGTRWVRFRPDKAPRQCTLDQVTRENRSSLPKALRGSSPGS